jgi:hypothetical protein
VRRPGGGVGAGVGWESEDGCRTCWGPLAGRGKVSGNTKGSSIRVECSYNFHGAIPRTGAEGVFCDEVPMDGENLALMLLPGLDRKVVERNIEEFYGPVARGND